MSLAPLIAATLCLLSALASALRTRRIRQWIRVKATVVHWHEAGPLGKRVSPTIIHEFPVVRLDGSEGVVRRSLPNPEITYFAELVYPYEASTFAADLAFDQPVGDTVDLLIDPKNPSHYEFPAPTFRPAATLATLAILLIGASLY